MENNIAEPSYCLATLNQRHILTSTFDPHLRPPSSVTTSPAHHTSSDHHSIFGSARLSESAIQALRSCPPRSVLDVLVPSVEHLNNYRYPSARKKSIPSLSSDVALANQASSTITDNDVSIYLQLDLLAFQLLEQSKCISRSIPTAIGSGYTPPPERVSEPKYTTSGMSLAAGTNTGAERYRIPRCDHQCLGFPVKASKLTMTIPDLANLEGTVRFLFRDSP